MYGQPTNYATNPPTQGYFVNPMAMNQAQDLNGPRVVGPIPSGGPPPGAFYGPGAQHFAGQTFVLANPNQPPPRMTNPNGYGPGGNGQAGSYSQSVPPSQASSNGSDGNSPTNASVQSTQQQPQLPAGPPPPAQFPPQQVPPHQLQQMYLGNPRYFNSQQAQMPPMQQFMHIPPPTIPPGYMPGQQIQIGQQPASSQTGIPPPPHMMRPMVYQMQQGMAGQQPQFVSPQIPLHPMQSIPPPMMARPGVPQQMQARSFVSPGNYRMIMHQRGPGPQQVIYLPAATPPANFVPTHQQIHPQGYVPQNASPYPPSHYRPDSRRSSTSYSRTQSESKFSDIKNEHPTSPDQNQLNPTQAPQYFQGQDGCFYQSPPSSVATYDTANAASGYQSPEVMMGYQQQYYMSGPPQQEGYQEQQYPHEGHQEEQGHQQQQQPQYSQQPMYQNSYEQQGQQQSDPDANRVEHEPSNAPSESKVSQNYTLTHQEQHQHAEYELHTGMSSLNLHENTASVANGPTREHKHPKQTFSHKHETADTATSWRKTSDLAKIKEESTKNTTPIIIECSYCRSRGESEEVYTSHNFLTPGAARIVCEKFREIGCSICQAKGDEVHLERICPKNQEPTPTCLLSFSKQVFENRGRNPTGKPNGHSMRGSRGSFRGSRERLDRSGYQKTGYKNFGGQQQGGYGQNYGGGMRKTSQGSYDGDRQGPRQDGGRGGRGRGERYDDGNRRPGRGGNYQRDNRPRQ